MKRIQLYKLSEVLRVTVNSDKNYKRAFLSAVLSKDKRYFNEEGILMLVKVEKSEITIAYV